LPQVSRKRILPAFLLCFLISAHRLYVGKYISGIIQIALVVGAYYWLKMSFGGLLEIVHNAPLNMETMERVSDWEQINGIPFLPLLAQLVPLVWIIVDARLLLARKFTDGRGLRITQWL